MTFKARYLICAVVVSGLLFSCTPETRYRVLSFFVDGVPKPGEPAERQGVRGERNRAEVQRLEVFEHGPYGARMCTSCHEGGFSNRLLLSKEKLCFHCHTFGMEARYVHGPLPGGGCLLCHDPHSTRYKSLLVSKPEEFCFYCHDRTRVLSGRTHINAAETACTACHDAHMSDRRYMLKEGVEAIEKEEPKREG